MTIDLSLPVWSLPIDWTDGVTETLEFLTTVGESPSAIEQRRGLRLTPRQYFEYQYILKGPERTYFDLLTMRSGGSPCLLPIWHDVEVLQVEHPAGTTVLNINTTFTEFMNCDAVLIGGPFDYELVEILGRADTLVTLTSGLINTWPAGTRVVPLKKVRLDQQPSTTRKTELIHVARVKFCSIEPNRTDAEPPLNLFGVQYVLETDPNEVDDLTYNYERVLSTLDNTMGLPALSDVTGRVLQQFAWWCKGRQEHHRLRGLFYSLDGRRVPVWVPTIYADFEPVSPIGASDLAIDVKRNGFTNLGGPQPQREYILIHLHDGTRYYRKITNSVILSDKVERIFIDAALGADVSLVALNRISFLVLCRLDQDAVEMIHHTATRGITTVVAVFRSAAAKDGIENIIEVPPGVVPSVVCLDDFVWQTALPTRPGGLAWGMRPDRLDRFGNYYDPRSSFEDSYTSVYNTNGVLIKTLYPSTIETDINTYYGFSVVSHKPIFYSTFASPIRQGRYVLAYLRTATVGYAYDHWWALYDPATWTVVGAINRYDLVGPPMANGVHIWEIYDDISPILFQGEYTYGAITNIIGVLPSINEFLDGTYNAGWGGFRPGYTPSAVLFPIGNYGLSYRFLVQMIRNSNRTWGFRLPGIGRQLLYIYVGRREVQYDITNTLFNPELRNVLGPVYPYGLMLKIPLGDVSSFADIAVGDLGHPVFKGHATEMYTIDNANWRDQDDGALIPFLDEYTYLSDDTIGGDDGYSVQVSTQLRTNGKYWVVFVMAGLADAKYRGGGAIDYADPVYARIRVFQYDPATEVAVQEFEHVCVLHTHADLPHTGTEGVRVITDNDTYIMAEIIEEGTIGTVILHMPVYKVSFCQFTLPEYL